MPTLDKNYWTGRWERGETGWHQAEAEPHLIAHFSRLTPRRIFVPLCGKSLDVAWLAKQGHEVVGIDLSELAVRALFEENRIPFATRPVGALTELKGGNVTIYVGDFFELSPEVLGPIGAIYDRAALIALPGDVRKRYADRICQFAQNHSAGLDFRFLVITLERTPHHSEGPPHSVPTAEVTSLYGRQFGITLLSREGVEMNDLDAEKYEECVYFLKPL